MASWFTKEIRVNWYKRVSFGLGSKLSVWKETKSGDQQCGLLIFREIVIVSVFCGLNEINQFVDQV
jgi:hypothetical protein